MDRRLPVRADLVGQREAGFTMLEVVVAMVLVGILASAMASITISTMRGVAGNRVNEQAVRLAERTMEQVRAMAFATVEAGVLTSEVAADPDVQSGVFNGEELLQGSTVTTGTPLNPYRRTGGQDNPDLLLDGVAFTVSTYPTRCWQPADSPGTCNADQSSSTDSPVVRVTVVVTSGARFGGDGTFRTSSLFFSPAGCMSTQTHPFSAPCQPYFYSTTSLAAGRVVVHGFDASTGAQSSEVIPGAASDSVNLVLGEAHANLQIEQISTITGFLRGSEAQVASDGEIVSRSGGRFAKAQVNTDPADGITLSDTPSPFSQVGDASLKAQGSGDWAVVAAPGSDQGSAVATTIASGPIGCTDSWGLVESNGQPCASAALSSQAAQVTLVKGSDPIVALLRSAAAASPSRVLAVRQLTPEGSRCSGTSAVGCVSGEYVLYAGSATVGEVPAWWSTAAPGLTSLIVVDPVQLRGAASSGLFSPTSPLPTAGLVGTTELRFWNGSSYSSQTLNVSADTPLRVTPRLASAGRCFELELAGRNVSDLPCITIVRDGISYTVAADLTVHPSYTTFANNTPCTSQVCSAEGGQAPLITGRVMVKVEDGATALVDLDAEVELAQNSTSTIYRASPAS